MDVLPQHERLRAVYKRAEDAIHELGIEGDGVDTLAINELRYAGNHILRSLTATNETTRVEELDRAFAHCQRALYEAYDSALFYQLRRFQKFRDDYRRTSISDVVPNYIQLSKEMMRGKALLERAREESSNREDYYEEAKGIYASMAEVADTLDSARDELNKTARDKSRTFWLTALTALAAAIVGGVVTTLGRALIGS